MEQNTPLVSICVITYNSAKYVIETLDSAKSQTYKNIELIISDDCSTDNTVEICKQWIECNGSIFKRVELLQSAINTGVSANLNRSFSACKGVWVKAIAGDDVLANNAIEAYVKFVLTNPDCRICYAKPFFFGVNEATAKGMSRHFEKNYYPYLKQNHKQQLRRIVRELFVPGPGLFMEYQLWKDVGGYDERYPFGEEHPFTYKVLALGNRIFFLNMELVGYRIREDSLGGNIISLTSNRVVQDICTYFFNERLWLMLKRGMFLQAWHQLGVHYGMSLKLQSQTSLFQRVLLLFVRATSPLTYVYSIKRLVCVK